MIGISSSLDTGRMTAATLVVSIMVALASCATTRDRVDHETNPLVLGQADSTVYERELILAVEACPRDKNIFCFGRDGTDNVILRNAVEFDTVCWNLLGAYERGMFQMGLAPPIRDSAIYLKWRTSRETFNSLDRPDESAPNIVWIQDEEYEDVFEDGRSETRFDGSPNEIRFEGFMYTLHRVRMKYLHRDVPKAPVMNFKGRHGDGLYVFRPMRVCPIVELEVIGPYAPRKDFCHTLE